MTRQKSLLAIFLILLAGMLSRQAIAQQWSDEQLEVWAFIQQCNEYFAAGDVERVLGCFHDDFSGWQYGDTVPRNKESIAAFLPLDLAAETLAYDLRPISIVVFGDFAVVHYASVSATQGADGEEVRQRMIWTDVMLRERGRWHWVADHGGAVD